jgi:metallo-beta-lactamase class B
LNAISFPGFRFTGSHGKPDITPAFRDSIAKVAALPCDIMITVHPDFSGVFERAAKAAKGEGAKAFVDPEACRAYANDALQLLEKRVGDERAGG